jgi:hypothetical protein
VKEVEIKGIKLSFNDTLYNNIVEMRKLIDNNFDNCLLVDGIEGYGKTRFSSTIAFLLSDGRFTHDNIIFTPKQFRDWADDPIRKPGDTLIWDEFVLAGIATDAMTTIQKEIIKYMTLFRKKRLNVILIAPYIFFLKKYFAIARTRNLIHVKPKDGKALERGEFDFYGYESKKKLYLRGFREWDYNVVSADFTGSFHDAPLNLIDWEAYERKKDEATKSIGNWKDQEEGENNQRFINELMQRISQGGR